MDNPDKIIERISKKATGDNEVLQAFQMLLKDNVKLPADGFVIDEPVSVNKIEYSGNERRGLMCRRLMCRRLALCPSALKIWKSGIPGNTIGEEKTNKWKNEHYPSLQQNPNLCLRWSRYGSGNMKVIPLTPPSAGQSMLKIPGRRQKQER